MSQKIAILASITGSLALAGCSAGNGQPGGESSGTVQSELSARSEAGIVARGAVLPRLPAAPTEIDSTVPTTNGDVNPYGVAFVPQGFPSGGLLSPGDVVVANFNNEGNAQGTGTTVVRVNANASPSVFFSDAATPGLTTSMGVLSKGFVITSNLPSTDMSGICTEGDAGQEENVGQGALLVIDRNGNLVQSITSAALLDGPWDLALDDDGDQALVFVSNVLSGTVTRLSLGVTDAGVTVQSETQIASGYTHRCDPNAFVLGPTGLAFDEVSGVLYVASTADNAIYAVHNAGLTTRDMGRGTVAVSDSKHLHGPLGLVRANNGDLISAQGDAVNADPNQPNEIVEFTRSGRFVSEFSVDPAPGSAFGVALVQSGFGFRFAAVDDGTNTLHLWVVQ